MEACASNDDALSVRDVYGPVSWALLAEIFHVSRLAAPIPL